MSDGALVSMLWLGRVTKCYEALNVEGWLRRPNATEVLEDTGSERLSSGLLCCHAGTALSDKVRTYWAQHKSERSSSCLIPTRG